MKPIYPAIRELADRASARAQRTYMIFTGLQLGFLALAALAAGISTAASDRQQAIAWSVCVLMFMALSASLVLKVGRFDVKWFKCRAFAENSKSLVWRFVMADSQTIQLNEDRYLLDWVSLEKRLHEVHSEFALSAPQADLATPWMTATIGLNLADKVSLYKRLRLQEQLEWYASNSRKNADAHERWFWSTFFIEIVVIIYAAIQAWRLPSINLVGFIVSTGTALLVWSQTKRFSDLATTYAVAAEDLRQIAFRYKGVGDQQTLEKLVQDVEEAVSREHSMWLSKRAGHC